MFISNIAWFTKFFPKENSKSGYVDIQTILGKKSDIFHSSFLYLMNESGLPKYQIMRPHYVKCTYYI